MQLTQSRPRDARIPSAGNTLHGDLVVCPGAAGVVLFAHGSGSSRHSSRNRFVAGALQQAGLGRDERRRPRASHLFAEPGTLEAVAQAASGWFREHFDRTRSQGAA